MKKTMLYLLTVVFSLLAANASAATFSYERTNGTLGGSAGGTFDSISSSYNQTTNQLDWAITNGQMAAGAVDGFWLVLSSGPNPKSSDKQLAIVYADFNSNTLLAYTYNGLNNANSITSPGVLIGDFSAGIINSGNTVGFSIDVSSINSFYDTNVEPDWEGMQYGENIGVWFHTTVGTSITGNAQSGYNFGYRRQAWYDTNMENTTVVPVPAALFLFAPALAGFATMRRKLALSK
ncbi:MAG: VPLPA-CTERM sorting domain-containing protein [Methylophagaceae bacterium]